MQFIGEIEEVWFGRYGSVLFGPFVWAQHMHAIKWAWAHHLKLMKKVLYLEFSPQKNFHLTMT